MTVATPLHILVSKVSLAQPASQPASQTPADRTEFENTEITRNGIVFVTYSRYGGCVACAFRFSHPNFLSI
ncbi:hypothetical protein C0Q70_15573 [Pomacea canaliculata]|uniref:Uncharacterized protein n=1 Tax=Pomacea canaliculata TaxID=400727 RepID=A0A2T7NV88_POMCA|nr:hypothetical protein C0Q70_15573 [Pomacea canaliculata]